MSGPPTDVAYTIISPISGLALHLSENDNKSIVTSPAFPTPRQSWVVLSSDDGTFTLRSLYNGRSIGFEGALVPGMNLVTGDPSVAKGWVFEQRPMGSYAISLPGSPFVVGVPSPAPRAPAQLVPQTGQPNQMWIFQAADF